MRKNKVALVYLDTVASLETLHWVSADKVFRDRAALVQLQTPQEAQANAA